jgi:hypothetical protein
VFRVTGRATHAIDKKLITGQRAVSAFGGMKTSEARAKGLTGATRAVGGLGEKNKKTGNSRWSEWNAAESGMLDLNSDPAKEIESGPRMQEFWGPSPTQEQYAEGRKGYGGEKGWQDKFEKKWIDEAEGAATQAINKRGLTAMSAEVNKSGSRIGRTSPSAYLQNKAKLRAAVNFVPGSSTRSPPKGKQEKIIRK